MNQQTVVIKSNKYGITLFLDKDTEFSELLKDIGEKFKASSKFFKDAQMAIAFEGRILSQEEQMDVIRVIQESSGLEILCILEQDALKEAYMKRVLEERRNSRLPVMADFIKGRFDPDRFWNQRQASLFLVM